MRNSLTRWKHTHTLHTHTACLVLGVCGARGRAQWEHPQPREAPVASEETPVAGME